MYSSNFFGGDNYATGYATSLHPLGPFTKAKNNPVLQKNTNKGSMVKGTGHCMIVDISNRLYCVYHGRTQKSGDQRVVFIDPIEIQPSKLLVVHNTQVNNK
jgi:beta-xylosidase